MVAKNFIHSPAMEEDSQALHYKSKFLCKFKHTSDLLTSFEPETQQVISFSAFLQKKGIPTIATDGGDLNFQENFKLPKAILSRSVAKLPAKCLPPKDSKSIQVGKRGKRELKLLKVNSRAAQAVAAAEVPQCQNNTLRKEMSQMGTQAETVNLFP